MIQLTEAQRRERDRLIAELSDDRLTPDRAEAQSAKLGLGPLTPTLDPARFDPMRETHWTLAMVVSWIAWADSERVRDCLPRWREQHQDWYWRACVVGDGVGGLRKRQGWLLERVHKGEAPFLFLQLCEAFAASEGAPHDPAQRHTIHDARHMLWEKLGAGELTAATIFQGAPHAIPAHEWAFLRSGESRDRDVLYLDRDSWHGPRYESDVLVPRDDVLRLWPATPPTVAGEARAEKALRGVCEFVAKDEALPKASEWQANAVSEFNISARGAARAWASVRKDYPALGSPKGKPKSRRPNP